MREDNLKVIARSDLKIIVWGQKESNMIEDDDEIIEHLQQQFDRRRNTSIDVVWTDPGSYRLPRCIGQQGLVVVNQTTAELVLETDTDQVVRIPMSDQLIEEVGQLLSAMPTGYLAGFKSDR